MGEGGYESTGSCRMGEVESVGTVELVCVCRLLRMGSDLFQMFVYGSVVGGWGNSMGVEWAIMGTFC